MFAGSAVAGLGGQRILEQSSGLGGVAFLEREHSKVVFNVGLRELVPLPTGQA